MLKDELRKTQKRPSILGHPKYRHKEEKTKMLKMCRKKLQKMHDPESLLCKAVLINNTLKYIQNSSAQMSVPYNKEHEDVSEEEIEAPDDHNETSKSKSSSSYRIEDILSEIVFPPPLAPQMEEFTDCKIEDKRNELNSEDFINVCDDGQHEVTHHSLQEETDLSEHVKWNETISLCNESKSYESEKVSDSLLSQTDAVKSCISDSFLSDLYCMPLHSIVCQV